MKNSYAPIKDSTPPGLSHQISREKYTSPIRNEYEQLLSKANNGNKMDLHGKDSIHPHVLIKDQNAFKSSSNTGRENGGFTENPQFVNTNKNLNTVQNLNSESEYD